ncbi:MAG: hypothetical protein ACOX19_06445 [Fermentimonas sp.]
MSVSRSGYYKWKNREPSKRDVNREEMIEKVRETHEAHGTHGYRWTAAFIRINMHVEISDNCAYKCFRYLGIKAETPAPGTLQTARGKGQVPEPHLFHLGDG